jgi:hypothetical protein
MCVAQNGSRLNFMQIQKVQNTAGNGQTYSCDNKVFFTNRLPDSQWMFQTAKQEGI